MTTITTFEDILAVLEQNPQLRSALRNYILDEEFKQLPAIVRRNQELLEQFIQQQAEITANLQAGMDRLNDTLNRFMVSTNAMLAAHAERMDRLETDVSVLKTDVAELKSDVSILKMDVAELKTDVSQLKTDVGWLKGHITPTIARRMIGKIADVTQCRRPRWLEEHEIIDIADDADTSRVPDNELESFRAIDLVLRAIDRTSATGEMQYVVIECSATVAANDVTRARRNADYLAKFTGRPAKAVVIGTEMPPTIANLAERESVHCITVTNKGARPR